MATILVIDDHAMTRRLLASVLGPKGHRVLEASDGAEGLEMVCLHHPDLVIADIIMPTMDGFEFVRQLRLNPAIAQTTVVYYTASYLQRETKHLAQAADVHHVLFKPANPQQILSIVDAALGAASPATAPRKTAPPQDFDRNHLRLITDTLSEKVNELESTSQRLAELIRISQQIALEDPAELLSGFCSGARELIGARYAGIAILDRAGQVQHFFTSGFEPGNEASQATPSLVEGLLKQVISERDCVRRKNLDGDPHKLGLPRGHPPVSSFLATPLASPSDSYGVLYLADKIGLEEFTDQDEEIALALAIQAAVSYENTRRFEEIRLHMRALEVEVEKRRRAETELQRSELQYRLLFEANPAPMWVFDPETLAFLAVNDAAIHHYGYTREEFLAMTLRDIRLPEDVPLLVESIPKHTSSLDAGPHGTWRHRKKDGALIEVEVHANNIDFDGRRSRLVLARDVTERNRAEKTLREQTRLSTLRAEIGTILTQDSPLQKTLQGCAEALLRNLDPAFARIWTLNEKENVLELQASAGMYTHLDGPHSRVPVGKFKIGLIAQERKPHLTNSVVGDPRVGDQEWAKREGMVAFAGYPLIVADRLIGVMAMFAGHALSGDILTALGSIADGIAVGIQRRQAELAYGQSQEWLKAIFDASRDGIGVEENGTIVFANDAFARIYGYDSPDELIGQQLSVLHSEKDNERINEFGRRRLKGEPVPDVYEFKGVRKDGTMIQLEASVSLLTIAGKNYTAAVVRDITERKSLEEQFRQAQKMDAIGRLAGGIAHDFNNLLTIINGYSDLILMEGHPMREEVEEIRQAASRAAGLTSQLLIFSRKQVVKPEVMNLNSVLSGIDRMLRRIIGEDIDLQTVLARDLGRLRADRGQIEQILMNLVVNARDAMPTGGILTIETGNLGLDQKYVDGHPDARPGPHVMLAVSDTGRGMDAQTLARIFEPFFTTKEAGKGTGLGLATVYAIVKGTGGHIRVYSEPGSGATFKIYFPRVDEADVDMKEREEAVPTASGSETILLAEDEEALRGLAHRILTQHGYTVLDARNGKEALRIAEEHPGQIHLMVTDVVMPEMGGRESAERLASVRPGMKVLYLSGYTDEAVIRHGVLEKEIAFLQKPFTPDLLTHKVREVLDS